MSFEKKKINHCVFSSPEQSSCELMPWRGVRPSSVNFFHLIDFFSRVTAEIYSKLGTNVPYEVPTNCCYFCVNPKAKMAALASDWQTMFYFFSRTAANVPYEDRNKCCYLLFESVSEWVSEKGFTSEQRRKVIHGRVKLRKRRNKEIQAVHPWLWLVDTFLTSSGNPFQGFIPNLAQMFLMGSRPSVITYYVSLKSKMAALVSDWMAYKKLIVLTFCFKFLSGIWLITNVKVEVYTCIHKNQVSDTGPLGLLL